MHISLLPIHQISKLQCRPVARMGIVIFLLLGFQNVFAQNPQMLVSPVNIGTNKDIQQIVTVSSGRAFFNVVDFNNPGSPLWGLWTSDGTQAGTVKLSLTAPGYNTYAATLLTPFGDKLVFAGDNTQTYGEIWITDGSQAGTTILESINIPASPVIPIMGITVMNNMVYYGVMSADKHLELKKTDGTVAGTSVVHDFGIYNQSMLVELKTIGNQIFFDLYDIDNGGDDLIYRSDGTDAGTIQLIDLTPDAAGHFLMSDFMPMGNNAYFMVGGFSNNASIYKSDGTVGGTGLLKLINPTSYNTNTFPSFAATSNLLYFAANDGVNGKVVWSTDGSPAGTKMISNPQLALNPTSLVTINDTVYFSGSNPSVGNELMRYDNSVSAPALVREIVPGSSGSNPKAVTGMNNTLIFNATRNAQEGSEFWVSDGSLVNTIEIANVNSGTNLSSNPRLFASSGNTAFFAADMDLNQDGLNDAVCFFKYVAPQKIWTGFYSTDPSNPSNWFPQGTPTGTDNVLLPNNPDQNISGGILFANDFINNGTVVNVGTGIMFINGDFYNSGTINNTSNGIFAIIGNGLHKAGSPGPYLGQITLASFVDLQLTSTSHFPNMRMDGLSKIYLGDNSITIDGFYSNLPVIVTDGFGTLSMPVSTTPVVFPIAATDASYTPVTITNNNGSSDYFSVGVKPGVQQGGNSGNFILGQVVNRTWDIHQLDANPSNADLTFQWNATDELPGFNRTAVNVSHFSGGSWDVGPVGAASGTDPFTYSRNNITSFSPFTISSFAGSLPLKLVSLTGTHTEKGILLNWLLASQEDLTGFDVEHSVDGIHFEKIASLPTHATLSYAYLDPNPATGSNLYRIKAHENDGKFSYSRIVLVGLNVNGGIALKLSPNPARDILNVQLDLPGDKANVRIVDLSGKTQSQQSINLVDNLSVSINISKLSSGTYYLWVSSGDRVECRKFIKL